MKREEDTLSREQLEEHRAEIENRIRNMFWTVSGDYSAFIRPDVEAFAQSKALALYNAVKQGAFSKYFDSEKLALYNLKKTALGADEKLLMELTQLCIDSAVYPPASAERSGIKAIREEAFRVLAEEKAETVPEKIRLCLVKRFLGEKDKEDEIIHRCADEIDKLSKNADSDEIIRIIDSIYNSVIDPEFEKRKGGLTRVLEMSTEEMLELRKLQEFTDEQLNTVLEKYMSVLKDELLKMKSMKPVSKQRYTPERSGNEEILQEPSPEETEKIYTYIERQFGISYLNRSEQERINRRLCTGIHRRCSLYFTDGILTNPAVKSTQYLRTQMQNLKNETYFNMKRRQVKRSVDVLSAMLKRVCIIRTDEDSVRSETGMINPARLWKVGRIKDAKLFDVKKKRDNSSFVADILIDGSSSQLLRQPQIAAQGYIISQALSNAGIPHKVSSFCSYWDYTMLHRFRDYDDADDKNKNILCFRAFAENRDGLAIRTVCDGLSQRKEDNKILIILSDGRPNHLGSNRAGSRRPAVYTGEAAIKDTALEVRKARNLGISVLGVFVGAEEDLFAEKKIFGKDFTYTRNISSFAHIVGSYLCRLMEQDI